MGYAGSTMQPRYDAVRTIGQDDNEMNKNNRVCETVANDVITTSTPLEMHLAGVHPRLHITAERLEAIRRRKGEQPYAYMFASMRRTVTALADSPLLAEGDSGDPIKLANFQASGVDKRGYGDRIHQAAGCYLLSGDADARDLALDTMRALAAYKDWGTSLTYGHWAHGMACGIDWLWDEIERDEREHLLDILLKHTKQVFEHWSSYHSGEPFGYTWNIMGVILGGLSAAAGALYGERPDVARYVNLATEKARASANALGEDGVSPEGMAYGSYYVTFMTHAFTFIRDLVGIDLFKTCAWYRRFPEAIHHHSLPRHAWNPGRRCIQFGDAHRDNSGASPSEPLWACARAFGDGNAQWLANEIATVVPGKEAGSPLAAFCYAPDVKPVAPDPATTLKHFTDLDIVIGRSDWSGDESVFAIKCGPPNGHKGTTQFANPLAGGHMQPSAGVLQVFSHGQWILAHPGYTWKDTAYHNCLLIDGKGQIGSESEWFEDLPFRQGAPTPHLLRVKPTDWGAYVLANPGPAYPQTFGVDCYYRHVFFIKPHCWVVVDAIRLQKPATPQVLWHTLTPLAEGEPGVFSTTNDTAATRITVVGAGTLVFTTEQQTILHSSRYEIDPLQRPRGQAATPGREQVFVTTIETSAAGEAPRTSVTCDDVGRNFIANVAGPSPLRLQFDPFSGDGWSG